MNGYGLIGDHRNRNCSSSIASTSDLRTCVVESPFQTTSAKKLETWMNTAGGKTIVMSERQKPDAGPDACADDSDPAIALLEQPVRGAPCIHHRLADCGDRSTDIRRDQIFRTFQESRFAVVVIRKAQTQRGDSHPLQHAAELNLAIPFAVPLREDHDGEIFARRKESAPYGIVFGKRRFDSARKLQDLAC